jgi:DMSO/TMAO reductase YedYZ heme-binding membrane subunit
MTREIAMRTSTSVIIGLATAGALAVGFGGLAAAGGWSTEGILEGTRLTARWAFPWFLAAWSASALARLWPGGWRTAMLRRRRAIGLAFAANHFVHLGFLLTAALAFHNRTGMVQVVGGGFGYLLVAAMAATSNDAAMRAMGRWWKVLHTTGGLVLLGIFTNSYAHRLEAKPWLAIPALGLIALAVALKLAAYVAAHRRRQLQPA